MPGIYVEVSNTNIRAGPGGFHAGNRLGGNAITEIIVSGRVAAQTVAADNKESNQSSIPRQRHSSRSRFLLLQGCSVSPSPLVLSCKFKAELL